MEAPCRPKAIVDRDASMNHKPAGLWPPILLVLPGKQSENQVSREGRRGPPDAAVVGRRERARGRGQAAARDGQGLKSESMFFQD
jgi:hypothetical protein